MGSTSTRRSMMPDHERSTATPPVLDGPQWRALLEARWQARLTELTERSLAYCPRCDAEPGGPW
jgi:hypothetical protein